MKGTSRRSEDQYEDARLKASLASSEKECAENVMIVDLVRNDLSKVAQKGTVKVDELFGVHTFASVHQMISSVSCRLQPDAGFASVLKATFPMGSMTGAPKISAMKIIDKLEGFKRGMFSGTIGFFAPGGYFDFNVVIRAICLDLENKLATVTAGGAITIHCDLESEWQECLLKLKPQLHALGIPIEEAFIQQA
jgi:para-aminobenzoate synthetase component 1